MQEICAVIAAGGLGTRLKDYKDKPYKIFGDNHIVFSLCIANHFA